jgi:hypothetical protein
MAPVGPLLRTSLTLNLGERHLHGDADHHSNNKHHHDSHDQLLP